MTKSYEFHVTLAKGAEKSTINGWRKTTFQNTDPSGYKVIREETLLTAEGTFENDLEATRFLIESTDKIKKNIVRAKIETSPNVFARNTLYYEAHWKLKGYLISTPKGLVRSINKDKGSVWYTLRSNEYSFFIDMYKTHNEYLSALDVVSERDVESVIFDTNRNVDVDWENTVY